MAPRDRARVGKLCADLLARSGAPLDRQLHAYRRLAEGGDADAAAWLGDRHRLGEGVAVDLTAARGWYERAADGGSVAGMRELGRAVEEGIGGPVELERARALYEAAAEHGADAFARARLAERWGLTWYRDDGRGGG